MAEIPVTTVLATTSIPEVGLLGQPQTVVARTIIGAASNSLVAETVLASVSFGSPNVNATVGVNTHRAPSSFKAKKRQSTGNGTNSGNATNGVFSSATKNDSVVVVAYYGWNYSPDVAAPPVVSGAGKTWSLVSSHLWNLDRNYAAIFVGTGTGGATTVTVDPDNVVDAYSWTAVEFTGIVGEFVDAGGGSGSHIYDDITGFTASASGLTLWAVGADNQNNGIDAAASTPAAGSWTLQGEHVNGTVTTDLWTTAAYQESDYRLTIETRAAAAQTFARAVVGSVTPVIVSGAQVGPPTVQATTSIGTPALLAAEESDTVTAITTVAGQWSFTDDFERADAGDGTLGGGWLQKYGGASSITGGVATASNAHRSVPSSRVYHGSVTYDSGTSLTVYVEEYYDPGGGVDFSVDWNGTVLSLYANGPDLDGIAEVSQALSAGDVIEYEFDLTQRFRAWVNGTLRLTLDNSTYLDTYPPSFPYAGPGNTAMYLAGSMRDITIAHGLRDGSDGLIVKTGSTVSPATVLATTSIESFPYVITEAATVQAVASVGTAGITSSATVFGNRIADPTFQTTALEGNPLTAWAYGSLGTATATSNADVAPDGTTSGFRYQTNNAFYYLRRRFTGVVPGETYTFAWWAKKVSGTAKYSVRDSSAGVNIIAPTSYPVQPSTTEYGMVSVTFTVPVGCSIVDVYPVRDGGNPIDIYLWDARVFAGSGIQHTQLRASIPTPVVSAGSTVSPVTAQATASVPSPTLPSGTNVAATTVQAVGTVGTPTISSGTERRPTAVPVVTHVSGQSYNILWPDDRYLASSTTWYGYYNHPGGVVEVRLYPWKGWGYHPYLNFFIRTGTNTHVIDVDTESSTYAWWEKPNTNFVQTGDLIEFEVDLNSHVKVWVNGSFYWETNNANRDGGSVVYPFPSLPSVWWSNADEDDGGLTVRPGLRDNSDGLIIQAGSVVSPATVQATATVGAVTVETGVSPITVTAVTSVGEPTFTSDATVTLGTVTAVAAVGTPTLVAGVLIKAWPTLNVTDLSWNVAAGGEVVHRNAQGFGGVLIEAINLLGDNWVDARSPLIPVQSHNAFFASPPFEFFLLSTNTSDAALWTVEIDWLDSDDAWISTTAALTNASTEGGTGAVAVGVIVPSGARSMQIHLHVAGTVLGQFYGLSFAELKQSFTAQTTISSPTKRAGSTVSPATVTATCLVGEATAQGSATTVQASVSIGSVTVEAGSTVLAATVAVTTTVDTPTVQAGSGETVTPQTVTASVVVPLPALFSHSLVQPGTVTVQTAIAAPLLAAFALVLAQTVEATATVGAVTVTTRRTPFRGWGVPIR